MRMTLLLIPPEMLALMIAAGGLAMVVGARKLAAALIGGALALAVLPAFLAPLFDALPGPVLTLLMVGMAIGIVFAVLRFLFDSTIGRNATDNMVGILAADAVRGTARGAFGLLGMTLRGVWRLLTLPFRR